MVVGFGDHIVLQLKLFKLFSTLIYFIGTYDTHVKYYIHPIYGIYIMKRELHLNMETDGICTV